MAQHEPKHCPRCNSPFECKVGSILQCQCSGLAFSDAEWDYIRLTYTDCLCRHCLQAIKHEISTNNTRQKMRAILAPIKRS
ncbi:cysteine-rich CWC family protein [Mucilaginibacter sp.]|uniref:cysteine-rich CWC family protein n=1 Tax=Mucilaginibacter sp. TaxID=1882438 RepID=UPI0025FE5335|nr:cysteine-rich CWC family protein [Mucilaginibacter sp.]